MGLNAEQRQLSFEATVCRAAAVVGTGWVLFWIAASVLVIYEGVRNPGSSDLGLLQQSLPFILICLGASLWSRLEREPDALASLAAPRRSTPRRAVNVALEIDHLRSIAKASYTAGGWVSSGLAAKPRARQRTSGAVSEQLSEAEIKARDQDDLRACESLRQQLECAVSQERWITARAVTRRLAEQAEVAARFDMGAFEAAGKGRNTDLPAVSSWLFRAATDGHPGIVRLFFFVGVSRQYRLGYRSLQGLDYRAPNWQRVVRWLRRNADIWRQEDFDLPRLGSGRVAESRRAADEALARWQTNSWDGSLRRQLLRADLDAQDSAAPLNLPKAAVWARQVATKGNARAQYLMACLHTFASPHRQNPERAFLWCQQAARREVLAAQTLLGDFHCWGFGTPRDLERALHWWHRAAERQWALAQYRLGCFYYFPPAKKGDIAGEARNAQQGIYWFRRAAEQGHAWAQAWLGRAFLFGIGVQQDLRQGVLWIRRAAESGVALAQFELGELYRWGRGVPRSYREAARWFRLAAAQGEPNAQTHLGNQHRLGRGTRRDLSEAAWWYRSAADQGHAEAQYRLACLYDKGWGVPQDDGKAYEWFLASARRGATPAALELGLKYLAGRGVERIPEEGVFWLKQAARRGHSLAQHHLGVCFAKGCGVAQNCLKAFFWHTLAIAGAAPGSLDARARLAGLLTHTQRREVLCAAERWISAFSEWKSGRRAAPPDVEEWLEARPASVPAEPR